MKRLLIIAALIFSAISMYPDRISGDDDDFDKFLKDAVAGFDRFIDDANRDFINFMRDSWDKYAAEKPIEKRIVPEPHEPIKFDPADVPAEDKPQELDIQEILDLTTSEGNQRLLTHTDGADGQLIPTGKPESDTVITRKPKVTVVRETPVGNPLPESISRQQPAPAAAHIPDDPLYKGGSGRDRFNYCGIDYHISNGLKKAIKLRGLDENSIADAYQSLFAADWQPIVKDLKKILDADFNGNEWALFLFIKQVASEFAGGNESMVMRQFLLNQLGYKARMARIADGVRLTLMVAPDCPLYGCIFVTEGGVRYYDVDAKVPYAFFMCRKDSPTAKKTVCMNASSHPRMAGATARSSHSAASAGISVTVEVPEVLMRFYSQYPQCDYRVYVNAGVNRSVNDALIRQLSLVTAESDKRVAAGKLLDFVQNGFDYATDKEQFGFEKPFFVEESFYYPKCDCEDRSILYRFLVKELLKLDVVLLEYPNHIATAVRFDGDTPGDFVDVNGVRYTVCDPTYIGAGIGRAMPEFRNTAAKVLRY